MKTKAFDKLNRQSVLSALSYLYLVGSFALLDVWLRVVTRWINAYSIYSLAPNLFTLAWSVLLVSLMIFLTPRGKIRRMAYALVYTVFLLLAIVQYGAYLILGKFLYISDFLYASEGMDYASYVLTFITPGLLLQIAALVLVGVGGCFALRFIPASSRKARRWNLGMIAACILGICLIPNLYGEADDKEVWNDFANPAREYEWFINPNFDLELTGLYQFFVRDGYQQIKRSSGYSDPEDIAEINAFFAGKQDHADNAMTGVFAGKNLIVVMLESVDDWMINSEHTPVLHYMKENGINFSNMYTPAYSSGYTFNTEFAYNTSVYPHTNGNVAYAMVQKKLDYGIPGVFSEAGYHANSFHEGMAQFYNRGEIHRVFGYERYHSYTSYPEEKLPVYDDEFLVESDALYQDVIGQKPFYSFVITFGGHLPYTGDEYSVDYALAKYPQYDVQEQRELNTFRAKVRSTDDMFRRLLMRLDEDQLLEDTVIVAYADHYAYGFSDTEYMKQETEKTGSPIMERTPAFIYCADWDQPMTVDKVMQTTDLGPTIMNLFGLEVRKEYMGHDVFDENYSGYAIFPGNTWITNEAYMKDGAMQWNNGMSDEEVVEMMTYVQKVHEINDKILDSDYYAHMHE